MGARVGGGGDGHVGIGIRMMLWVLRVLARVWW